MTRGEMLPNKTDPLQIVPAGLSKQLSLHDDSSLMRMFVAMALLYKRPVLVCMVILPGLKQPLLLLLLVLFVENPPCARFLSAAPQMAAF